jgi:hypothetical protein
VWTLVSVHIARIPPWAVRLTSTDLHPSNIFVNEDWRIISLIDLEWACSPPIELQTPPYWLCGRLVDGIEREHLEVFERRINEFINPFEEQHSNPVQAEIMGSCWKRGSFWYVQAVNTAKGLLRIFTEHILYRRVLRGPLHPEHTVFSTTLLVHTGAWVRITSCRRSWRMMTRTRGD